MTTRLLVFLYYFLDITTSLDLNKFPQPQQCSDNKLSYICDPYDYLALNESLKLDQLILNSTKAKLINCGTTSKSKDIRGVQLGIVIINSIDKNIPFHITNYFDTSSLEQKAEKYARHIHDTWGVGDQYCNNGILIFVTIEDRYMFISTGKSINDIITQSLITSYIIPNVRSNMRSEEYSIALTNIIQNINEILFDHLNNIKFNHNNKMDRANNSELDGMI